MYCCLPHDNVSYNQAVVGSSAPLKPRHLLFCFNTVLIVTGNVKFSLPGYDEHHEEQLRLKGLVGCYALLQYLTVGIQAANSVYHQAREAMEVLHHTLALAKQEGCDKEASSAAASVDQPVEDVAMLASECEAIAVQQAALLRYHNSVDVFPLATLRQTLTSSLTAWPNCAPLWTIYVQVRVFS